VVGKKTANKLLMELAGGKHDRGGFLGQKNRNAARILLASIKEPAASLMWQKKGGEEVHQ